MSDLTPSEKLERKWIGVRVGLSITAVFCFFMTLFALGTFPDLSQAETLEALEWLVGFLGVVAIGDTVRPSGQKGAAIGATKT